MRIACLYTIKDLKTKTIDMRHQRQTSGKLLHQTKNFTPFWAWRNKHVQTILPSQLPSDTSLEKQAVEINVTPSLQITGFEYIQPNTPLLILFHGLGGSSESSYMSQTAQALYHQGYSVATMCLPGNGNQSPYLYQAGNFNTFDFVQKHFEKSFDTIYWIGFSLSGNMLLHWLKNKKNIQAGVAISPIINLSKGVALIDIRKHFLYRTYFLSTLKKQLKKKLLLHPEMFHPYQKALSSKYLREFDELFTCPFHGYKNTATYYEINSSLQHIPSIENHCAIIHAKDDPFIDPHDFDRLQSMDLPCVDLLTSQFGGHVGFFQNFQKKYCFIPWITQYFASKSKESLNLL